MALATRCKAPAAVSAVRSRRSVRVACHKGALEQVQVAAAAVAAAAIIAAPANAGVVLQQPELKKVFQSDAPAPVKREVKTPSLLPDLPAAKEAPAPKAEKKAESGEGFSLDPRSVALPGALVLTLAGGLAASKLDSGFNDWFMSAMSKDSNDVGVGYEPTLKTENGVVFPKSVATGTKKVKAAGATKKGGLGGFFGKK